VKGKRSICWNGGGNTKVSRIGGNEKKERKESRQKKKKGIGEEADCVPGHCGRVQLFQRRGEKGYIEEEKARKKGEN